MPVFLRRARRAGTPAGLPPSAAAHAGPTPPAAARPGGDRHLQELPP
ncbi:hypothetical protein GN316_13475 [Xylophilus sp. Kf1]|nr:hypothetical protein [Xylophilus sp. Kf1]